MANEPVDEGSAAGLPPAARQAFEALRQRFLAGLTGRWRDIAEATNDGERRAALHRLAGAAGSFGCPALSALAREAERAAPGQLPALLVALERQVQADADTVR